MLTLYSIPYSHYNEKIRWCLDYCGIAYRSKSYLPLFHIPLLLLAGVKPGQAGPHYSPFSTPVIKTAEGHVVRPAEAILELLREHYPQSRALITDEALALDKSLTDEFGPAVRIIANRHCFQNPKLFRQMIWHNVGIVQGTLGWLMSPLLIMALKRLLKVNDENYQRAIAKVNRILDDLSQRLSKQPYLAGDQWSLADISFASLAAPILGINQQQGYGAWLPETSAFPQDVQALIHQYQESVAGKFAIKCYNQARQKHA